MPVPPLHRSLQGQTTQGLAFFRRWFAGEAALRGGNNTPGFRLHQFIRQHNFLGLQRQAADGEQIGPCPGNQISQWIDTVAACPHFVDITYHRAQFFTPDDGVTVPGGTDQGTGEAIHINLRFLARNRQVFCLKRMDGNSGHILIQKPHKTLTPMGCTQQVTGHEAIFLGIGCCASLLFRFFRLFFTPGLILLIVRCLLYRIS